MKTIDTLPPLKCVSLWQEVLGLEPSQITPTLFEYALSEVGQNYRASPSGVGSWYCCVNSHVFSLTLYQPMTHIAL